MDKSNFLPIRVSTLKGGVNLGFDIYIELPHKLLMYVRGNYDIEQHRIESLRSKKVRKLFINEAAEENYQEYIDRCLSAVAEDPNMPSEEKTKMVVGAGEATAERIYDNPEQIKSYRAAANTSQNLLKVLKTNEDLLKNIFDHGDASENKDHDSLMHRHSVNTASLCISFAESIGLPPEQVEALGIAGLYHDVAYGKSEPAVQELYFKPLNEMSLDEQKVYKQHPEQGKNFLVDKEFVSPLVLELIYSHEEKNQGNGFPQKLGSLNIGQEIISICAYYDRALTCLGYSRADVFEAFSTNELGNYNLETIKKFKSFIKKSGL